MSKKEIILKNNKFDVYLEKDIFKEIIESDRFPNWNKILTDYSQVLLNMTEKEFFAETSSDNSIYVRFLLNPKALAVVPLGSQFESIKKDYSTALNHPRAVYILDISLNEAKKISNDLGIAVFSSENLSDTYFEGGLFKELVAGDKEKGGWKSLISIKLPVSNSLVISDPYLFEDWKIMKDDEVDSEEAIKSRVLSFSQMIKTFLPKYLKTEYYITIISGKEKEKRSSAGWKKIFDVLKEEINIIKEEKSYEIIFELLITSAPHKRRIISNYINCWSDKGFRLFKFENFEIVKDYNDIHVHRIFNNIHDQGFTHYESATIALDFINKEYETVRRLNENSEIKSGKGFIFSSSGRSEIQNRMLTSIK